MGGMQHKGLEASQANLRHLAAEMVQYVCTRVVAIELRADFADSLYRSSARERQTFCRRSGQEPTPKPSRASTKNQQLPKVTS